MSGEAGARVTRVSAKPPSLRGAGLVHGHCVEGLYYGGRAPYAFPELHGRWVNWLILSGLTNKAIRNTLADVSLPCTTNAELDRRRRTHQPPTGFSLTPPLSPASECYLCFLHLDRLALGARDVEHAHAILTTPRARELVEAAILLNEPLALVVHAVRERVGSSHSVESIETFSKIWFSFDALTQAQRQLAVQERVRFELRRWASPRSTRLDIANALARDPRVIAATLPSGRRTRLMVWRQLGLRGP